MLEHRLQHPLHRRHRLKHLQPPPRLRSRIPHGIPSLKHDIPAMGAPRGTLPLFRRAVGSGVRYESYAEVSACAGGAGGTEGGVGWGEGEE